MRKAAGTGGPRRRGQTLGGRHERAGSHKGRGRRGGVAKLLSTVAPALGQPPAHPLHRTDLWRAPTYSTTARYLAPPSPHPVAPPPDNAPVSRTMSRLSFLLVAAALMAVATGAAATTSPPGPTPTPKTMKITKESGEECISKWFVTGYADGKWVWADVDICCPPRPMTKTMIVFRGGKRCTSTWAACDRELNAADKCVWKICDVTDCETPVCPPKPMEMKRRFVRVTGERCVSRWYACGKKIEHGRCTWKGCDVVTCKPPCPPKPATKNMMRRTPTKVCSSAWWAYKLTVDNSTDAQTCKWLWRDVEECYCDTGAPKWTKC